MVLGAGSNGALDTVFKAVSVNGAVYNYYYDAFNRRRLKVYPAGPMDETFQDLSNELLVDQGNDSVTSPTWYPTDEYVWLGGRPVVLIRSKFNTSWARQADLTGDCTRNADAAPCNFYFPVTDTIGKPILMLDASRKVTGAADYDIFGLPNRVSLDKETAHPYANNTNITLADFIQPLGGAANPSTQVRVRAVFDLVDTEGPTGSPADYFYLKDPDGGVALTGHLGGPHVGQVWTAWVFPSAGRVQVPFVSNGTGNTYSGVAMAGYEYQRFQTGAQPFWTPLGFPGQYHDAETDLFQNWNRFYDAAVGRYLEPEPMLQRPAYEIGLARGGSSTAAYAYAQSSPLSSSDPSGLYIKHGSCKNWSPALNLARKKAGCDGGCPTCKLPCNVCDTLKDGTLPGAYIRQGGELGGNGRNPGGTGPVKNGSGAYGVILNEIYCGSDGFVNVLAEAMLHEALHVCKYFSGIDVPATNDNWTRSIFGFNAGFSPDAGDVTKKCFGNDFQDPP
jgi:RHS repeat-associated protein